jgi:DNA-binding Lrp family transcriptional regulator
MKLPISKISELTGIHRDTISKRLADLPFEAGKKGAKLYSSEEALAAIYKTDSLEAARAEQARTAAQLNAIRGDVLRKTRIPISIVLQVHDEIFQATAATLKAAEGKLLSRELINNIFHKFRSIPAKLKW